MSTADEQRLRGLYAAFNSRQVDTVLESMRPDVDWPNAWEGGRVVGHDEVRAYWARQLESIRGTVAPEHFEWKADGSVAVTVHQVVRDATTDAVLSDSHVVHRYWFEDGLVVRMEVEGA